MPLSKPSISLARTGKLALRICAWVSVFTTLGTILVLATESAGFFMEVSLVEFLFGTRWEPLLEPKSFGVLPLLGGTLLVVVGALSVALPLGLATSIYLSEYASRRSRQYLKPILEVLAGIPTVVYGYFALTFITPALKFIHPETEVFNAASAAIVVGIMVLPMVSSLFDDAFQALPQHDRSSGYALGATSFEVVWGILIPRVSRRLVSSSILAFSRAIGETMAVTLAAGASPRLTLNPLESIQTMTSYIVQVSLGDTPAGGIEYQSSFAVGAFLFILTLTINSLAIHLASQKETSSP